ncbi:hypothetical protein [Uliginosibacterium flavum]|uniref:Zinc ribbon domain-containing protein n=1 Tax=Uliginosibacterium flavum TaxID=1396831 RepID=A0ABV2TKW1_9RHOO
MPKDFQLFIAVWIALGIGSALFFFLNRNAALKRRVLPLFIIVTSALFLGFIWFSSKSTQVLQFMGPAVVLIAILNIRTIRFCDDCGRTIHNQNPFSSPKFCSKCGAKIK